MKRKIQKIKVKREKKKHTKLNTMSQLCNACIRISIIIEKRKQLTRQHTNTLPPVCKWRRRRPRPRRRRLQRSTYYYHNAALVYTRMRARTKPKRCLVIWLVILSIVDCRSRVSALQPITASAIPLMRLCFAKNRKSLKTWQCAYSNNQPKCWSSLDFKAKMLELTWSISI